MTANDPELRIQQYLSRLRSQLQGGAAGNADEIVAELRNHIVERSMIAGEMTEANVHDVLQRLGTPEELAEQYAFDAGEPILEPRRPNGSRANRIFWWTRLVAGAPILLFAAAGYFLGAALLICAVSKPFHPYSAGLWKIPDLADVTVSLRLGFGSGLPPVGSSDLLGWWIVPGGLVSGFMLLALATQLALWSLRLYRRFDRLSGTYGGGIVYGS